MSPTATPEPTATPIPNDPSRVQIEATATRVDFGGSFLLSWNIPGAIDCNASGPNGFEGALPPSGTRVIQVQEIEDMYLISCLFNDGQVHANQVFVPVVTEEGGSGSLSWLSLGFAGLLVLRRRRLRP